MAKQIVIDDKQIIKVDWKALEGQGISKKDVFKLITEWTTQSIPVTCSPLQLWFLRRLQLPVQLILQALKPRADKGGDLSKEEVMEVYTEKAGRYDKIHHYTTYFEDSAWRSMAANFVNCLAMKQDRVKVLDLCTGTGLTAKAILSQDSENKVNLTCLDYTPAMLQVAMKNLQGFGSYTIVRGDATDLTSSDGIRFARFDPESFDGVTQMCGIGGIGDPLAVFREVLAVLKPGGQYFMSDMHKPDPRFPKGMPILGFEVFSRALEMVSWLETTLPLALKQLWGWHDPSPDFHLLPITTYQDPAGDWWGFDRLVFFHRNEKWWLGFPIMGVGVTIVKKVQITAEEAKKRQAILSACSFTRLPS